MIHRAATLVLAASALCASARADQVPARSAEEAKAQYDKGTRAYNVEKFDDAIAAFTRAYEIDPAPILLYNIAQSHWKKGENERAVSFYRRYLEAEPAAENRGRIEERIRQLEEKPKPAPAPPTPLPALPALPAPSGTITAPPVALLDRAPAPAAVATERPLYRKPWFWGAVAGVAAASVAAVFLLRPGEPTFSCGPCPGKTYTVPAP